MTLALNDISRSFGGVEAVSRVNLKVSNARITGLIGPNGAGKTTVVNLIAGFLKPGMGTIEFNDEDITTLSPYRVARLGIARTFQNIRLLANATVLDNVMIGMHLHEQTNIWDNLFGLPAAWREAKQLKTRAYSLIDRFGMTQFAEARAGSLSYGHQRRVEMMRALAADPSLLLLDEPVAGMNDFEAEELGAIFRSLSKDGLAILLIEHNMRLVMNVCDYIYVLASGKQIAEGGPTAIQSDAAVIEAYLGQ